MTRPPRAKRALGTGSLLTNRFATNIRTATCYKNTGTSPCSACVCTPSVTCVRPAQERKKPYREASCGGGRARSSGFALTRFEILVVAKSRLISGEQGEEGEGRTCCQNQT